MFLRWNELQKEINQRIDGETRLPSGSFQINGVRVAVSSKSSLHCQKDIEKIIMLITGRFK